MEKTPPATFMGRPVQVAHTGKAWCENFSVVVALPAGRHRQSGETKSMVRRLRGG